MISPHLDDDALSAVLDDASTQAEAAHVADCSMCQARLEQLAAVAAVIGAPVPAPPRADLAAAIERAMGPPAATAAGLSPVDRAAPPNRPRRRWLAPAAAATAALVLVGGVATLIIRGGSSTRMSASQSASGSAATTAPGGATSRAGTATAVAPGANLGDVSDPTQLSRVITARLPDRAAASPAAGAAPRAGPAEMGCVGTALTAGRLDARQAGLLRFVAPLRWRGQPATVFVMARPGPPGRRIAVVLRTADCSLLSTVPLQP